MSRKEFPVLIALILLIATIAIALQTATARALPAAFEARVVLTDEQAQYPLGQYLYILEDPSRELTIADVSSPAYDSRFVRSQSDVPNYGYTTSAYWVKLSIENRSEKTQDWLLDAGYPNIFYMDLYTPLQEGKGFSEKQSGVLRSPATRDVLGADIIFKLKIPIRGQQTIYLRFENGGSMTLSLKLVKESDFLRTALPDFLLAGLLYGVIIGLLLYNSFLLISVRDQPYIFLVAFLAAFLLWVGSYDGFTEIFILRNYYYLKPYYFPVFFDLLWVTFVVFGDSFFELKTQLPHFHKATIFLLIIWGLLLLLIPFVQYSPLARWMLIWAVFSAVTVMAAGILLWRQRYLATRFFMIAAFGFLISVILTIFVRFGILPSNFLTENIFRIGAVWLAIFWSITLASRINHMKAETESANRDLQNSEHRLSQILDGMPLGVVLYASDHKPKYANRSTMELLSHPDQGVQPDLSLGRTVAQAIEYFSFKVAGSQEPYPLENFPVYSALQGRPAYVDDVEMHVGDKIIPLEIWASPITNETGEVESAVAVFEDINLRRQTEAELAQYRRQLESLVEKRTAEVNAANKELRSRLEWLAAVNLVNQMIAQSAEFSQIHERIVEIVNHLFSIQNSFIAEIDKETGWLKILAHSDSSLHPGLIGSFIPLSENIPTDSDLEPGKAVMISSDTFNQLNGPMGTHIRESEVQNIAFIPLQVREQVLGFLGLEIHEKDRIITIEEANLLSIFSTDIAQLIEDARLFEQAKLLVATEERNRLARELHDSVAQTLYSISLFIDATRLALKTNKTTVVESHLEELSQLSREAMSDMRLLIFELRPPILEKSGLAAALQSRLESVEAKAGFETSFETNGSIRLSSAQESEFYRIAQEALNNVIKHAQADRVAVRLIGEPGFVRMTIEDDGVGFDPASAEHGGGQGFRNMHERAANIGARCLFESVPGQGTKIMIEVNE
jgi:signal transduction histidine kinase